ncbi:hypothetical protein DICPUDRAFT_94707 [Dictyostelium purpureum]|uniref:Uncharacterized protein n=1 Tax=Dictyostelium purpureum TaxID=5786 RepID=F0ZMN5_DICPU|nr:uncharacterized protein DICPUDRAFT_94707 [Dictyostelium purpureum]EGC34822.1 hypothetical protein DICPUDRAFT_94707 [Dictyostelium purpureum]|eukprot:XP_003288679.1 hypothetical protein DICPUDRAFT_94707 [Dictyostelium purpureum]
MYMQPRINNTYIVYPSSPPSSECYFNISNSPPKNIYLGGHSPPKSHFIVNHNINNNSNNINNNSNNLNNEGGNLSSPQYLSPYNNIQLERFNLNETVNKKRNRLSWKDIKKEFNLKHEIEKEEKKLKKFEKKVKEEMKKDKIKQKKKESKEKKELSRELLKKLEIKFKLYYSNEEWIKFENKYKNQLIDEQLLENIIELIF